MPGLYMQVVTNSSPPLGAGGDASASPPSSRGADVHRVGPNTLIQTLEAVRSRRGASWSVYLAARASLPDPLPQTMVDERLFGRVVGELVRELGLTESRSILATAGERTGAYVLHNRIPRLAKAGLRLLPRSLRLRTLMKAIEKHAWTFTGSGRFRHRITSGGAEFTLDPSLVCTVAGPAPHPMGSYYAGAFRTLIRSLVNIRASVEETECTCCGGDTCRFRIVVSPSPGPAPFEHLPE